MVIACNKIGGEGWFSIFWGQMRSGYMPAAFSNSHQRPDRHVAIFAKTMMPHAGQRTTVETHRHTTALGASVLETRDKQETQISTTPPKSNETEKYHFVHIVDNEAATVWSDQDFK